MPKKLLKESISIVEYNHDPLLTCMKRFEVSEDLLYGVYYLHNLNRTSAEDMQKIGCVRKCTLEHTGFLTSGKSVKDAFEHKARSSFEETNREMRNDLDEQLKGIQKCSNLLDGSAHDECVVAYQLQRCLEQSNIYIY